MRTLIVGAGGIAPDYVKALRAIGVDDIHVLSRRRESAAALASRFGLGGHFGGGAEQLARVAPDYDAIILAASIDALLPLLRTSASVAPHVPVLVEKPVALSSLDLDAFVSDFPKNRASVALNRLFFPSVALVRERLVSDPATSTNFSFTEWVHRIDPSKYSEGELARWGLSNCIHVIATVFDLVGLPETLAPQVGGQGVIGWHPSGSIYAGSGRSKSGVTFSYLSDWNSAGRWSISIGTAQGRYDLVPMEGVTFTPKGSVQAQSVLPPYGGDTKCGFVEMLAQWLRPTAPGRGPVSVEELTGYVRVTEAMFGYRCT